MGLGSTAKKLQGISESAEKMYKQVQELQGRIISLEEEVDETHDTVTGLDHRVSEQRALLVAIAEEQGLDAEAILAEAAIEEAEAEAEAEEPDAAGDADAETDDPESETDATDATAE